VINGVITCGATDKIKIKINKVPEAGTAKRKTSEDEHKFTQLRGLVREGPLREKHRKTLEGEPQVYSVKKTCGSEFEVCGKAARSVPLHNPSKEHLDKAKYILCYLAGTAKYVLVYKGTSNKGLIAYTDSDYAADPVKHRSTTGYHLKLADGIISWQSRAQKTIALSANEAVKLNIWLCLIAANKLFGYKIFSLNLASQYSQLRYAWIMKVAFLLPQIQFRNDAPNTLMCGSITCVI